LPGKTPQEQDVAFFGEMQRRGLLVATSKVATDEEAQRAWTQLADLNMRTLRWGIPLPRWTEDSFDGSEHKSINDWISVFPRMPKDNKWYELVDAYLADPTDERFLTMTRSVATLTTDNGAAAKGDTAIADTSFSNFFKGKSDAALLASHMFRLAATGKKGWADLGAPPFPQQMSYGIVHGLPHNPMRTIGNTFQEDHCFDKPNGGCEMAQTRALPPMAAVEIDTQAGFPNQVQPLTHPWWSLGFLFDPTLSYKNDRLPGPSGFINFGEVQYWTDKFNSVNFPHKQIHEPFIFTVNFVKRVTHLDRNKKPGDKTAAVLHGGIFPGSTYIKLGFSFTKLPENNRLLINLMRTVFFKMRREIDAGAAATARMANYGDHDLEGGLRLWKGYLDGFAKGTSPEAAEAANTAALAADLLTRLATVPRVTPSY
jgi:hypothetical protein